MCSYVYKSKGREEERCPYDDYGQMTVQYEGSLRKLCVFHDPTTNKNADRFWKMFGALINSSINKGITEWDFEGFVFPQGPSVIKEYACRDSGTINFKYTSFISEADFVKSEFKGKVDFSYANFPEGANFAGSHFDGIVKFDNSEFEGEYASFSNCIFRSLAYFSSTQFKSKHTNFTGTRSYGHFNLKNAEFGSKVYAMYGKFYDGIVLSSATFYEDVNFTNSKIRNTSRFNATVFEGDADFSGVKFIRKKRDQNEITYFSGATFKNRVLFWETKCSTTMQFNLTKFIGTANFINSWFKGPLDLTSASFHSQADFQGSRISFVDFTGTSCNIPPYLGNLRAASHVVEIKNYVGSGFFEFREGFKPTNTSVEKPFKIFINRGSYNGVLSMRAPISDIIIQAVTINGGFYGNPRSISKLPYFSATHANFVGEAVIWYVRIRELINCNIKSGLKIAHSDLSKAQFLGVDLKKIDFFNVTSWTPILRKRPGLYRILYTCMNIISFNYLRKIINPFEEWLGNRRLKNISLLYRVVFFRRTQGLFDEILSGNIVRLDNAYIAPNLKNLGRSGGRPLVEKYRAIAASYENRKRFGEAGNFKVGEFEIRTQISSYYRKWIPGIEKLIFIPYHWVSFYGEEVLKPLLVVLLIVLIPAFVYFFTGIPVPYSEDGRTLYNYISYTPDLSPEGFKNLWGVFCDFLKAIVLSLEASFPLKSAKVEAIEGWASFIPTVQRAFTAIFAAFFAFALRRKARR